MNIKKRVLKLTKKHSTNNPFLIAKGKNIILEYAELGNTLGFYFYDSRFKVININNRLNEALQRFVCAHELGHAVLHPRVSTPFLRKNTFFSVDKIEVEANTFAVELLLPDECLSEYRDTNLSLEKIADIYGVPRELMRLKSYECS